VKKKYWLKNVLLLQYLFIEILCAKMSRVNKALQGPFEFLWLVNKKDKKIMKIKPQFMGLFQFCRSLKGIFVTKNRTIL